MFTLSRYVIAMTEEVFDPFDPSNFLLVFLAVGLFVSLSGAGFWVSTISAGLVVCCLVGVIWSERSDTRWRYHDQVVQQHARHLRHLIRTATGEKLKSGTTGAIPDVEGTQSVEATEDVVTQPTGDPAFVVDTDPKQRFTEHLLRMELASDKHSSLWGWGRPTFGIHKSRGLAHMSDRMLSSGHALTHHGLRDSRGDGFLHWSDPTYVMPPFLDVAPYHWVQRYSGTEEIIGDALNDMGTIFVVISPEFQSKAVNTEAQHSELVRRLLAFSAASRLKKRAEEANED